MLAPDNSSTNSNTAPQGGVADPGSFALPEATPAFSLGGIPDFVAPSLSPAPGQVSALGNETTQRRLVRPRDPSVPGGPGGSQRHVTSTPKARDRKLWWIILAVVIALVLGGTLWGLFAGLIADLRSGETSVPGSPGVRWELTLGGSQDEGFLAATTTAADEIIAVGFTTSLDGDFPIQQSGHIQLPVAAKVTLDGTLVWTQAFTHPDLVGKAFNAVAATPDGGFIAAASNCPIYTQAPLGDIFDACTTVVSKIDAAGAVVWARPLVGKGDFVLYSIALTSDGGVIGAGRADVTDGPIYTNGGYPNGLLVKLTSTGEVAWTKTYDTSIAEWFTGVDLDDAGNIMAVGSTVLREGPDWPGVGVVVKFSSDGTLIWNRYYDNCVIFCRFLDGALGDNGVFIATGYEALAAFDPSGELLWERDSTGWLFAVAVDATGQVITGEESQIRAYTAQGSPEWVQDFDPDDQIRVFYSISAPSSGVIVAVGWTTATWNSQADALIVCLGAF